MATKGENIMSKQVLLVEDDRFAGEIYTRALKQAGFDVKWLSDGNEALVVARDQKHDLILLDINLPERKGREILEILRGKKDLIPDTKLVILTNFQQDEESRRSFELKADAYLDKSNLTPSKLLKIIEEIFEWQEDLK